MKNPHIRTLPSRRPIVCGELIPVRLYAKRKVKEWKLWMRGEGNMPELIKPEIGRIERFRIIVSQ